MLERLRRPFAIAVALAVACAAVATAAASGDHGVVAKGLSNPRGIAVGPDGQILVAETAAGDSAAPGAITTIAPKGKKHGDQKDSGKGKGSDTSWGGKSSHDGKSSKLPMSVDVPGAVDVVVGKLGQTYVVTGAAQAPDEGSGQTAAPTTQVSGTAPVAHPASLLRLLPNGKTVVVADIGAYQKTDPDPYDLDQPPNPTESNPNGAALLRDGSVLVADAAADDLLRITPDGKITTVARFKPETVKVPVDIPNGPKAGTMLPAEPVPTAVSVGPDGAYYVSELKGFPFAPGTSRIWRIAPGVTGALCDPASTATVESGAACVSYAAGFTSIIDLAWGKNDALYVLEIARKGVGALESDTGDPTGALFVVRNGHADEIAAGALLAPGGIAIDRHNRLFVTTGTVLGPNAGTVVSLPG
jgi:hypothetical protein